MTFNDAEAGTNTIALLPLNVIAPPYLPSVDQVALLDRFVPLKTDVTGAADGLSLYDLDNGKTSLVAIGVGNVQAAGALLWWSTGSGDSVTWSALDLGAG